MQKKEPKDTPAIVSCRPATAGLHAEVAASASKSVTCLSRYSADHNKPITACRPVYRTCICLPVIVRVKDMTIRHAGPEKLKYTPERDFSRSLIESPLR